MLPRDYPAFNKALRYFWGSHWEEAAIVSYGEGGWSPYAQNGQYLGTFQMGYVARSVYGHSYDLWNQARYAHALWRDRGWSPWDCIA